MKANEIIKELFDKPGAISIKTQTEYNFETELQTGGKKIVFSGEGDGIDGFWEVVFLELVPDGSWEYRKTGTGREFEVFSFVVESLKMLINKYRPSTVLFTSEKGEANRTSLYLRMAKKISIPGYRLDFSKRETGSYDVFKLIKDQ